MSLKRTHSGLSDEADSQPPAKKPAKEPARILHQHDKARRRTYFWCVTPETEMQTRLTSTDRANFEDDGKMFPFEPPEREVVEAQWKLVKEMEPGDYATIDWPLPKQLVEVGRVHGEESVPNEEEEMVALVEKYEQIQKSLCKHCKDLVAESKILSRPWRRDIQDEPGTAESQRTVKQEAIPWQGKKAEPYYHHQTLGALRRSALAGCHLCSLIDAPDPHLAWSYWYNEQSTQEYTLLVLFGKNHNEGPGVIMVQLKGKMQIKWAKRELTRAIKLMYGDPGYKATPTVLQTQTKSKEVLDLCKNWLATCLERHEACRARAATSIGFVPTRLIQIKAVGDAITSLRLVQGADLPLKTPYLTLSHCWGGADIIKLTESTLETFKRIIWFQRLPKNFRDAITATALLGYEYVWIDSLCIIQDSKEDWKAEAARMGSVYRHSVCTIAALGAPNSHGGCFRQRSHMAFVPCQLIPHTKEKPGVYADIWSGPFKPLHRRAWVVQERALSIRTLNFGNEQVSWDCISAQAEELFPGMTDATYEGGLKRTFNDLLGQGKSIHDPAWINNWWKLVSKYSSCNLTVATDKWPAMSGMATEVENDVQRKLVHGLWASNLTDEPEFLCVFLVFEMASWSWLSIKGTVNRQRYDYTKDFRLSATATFLPSSPDNQGIQVTAHMLKMKWTPRPINTKLRHFEHEEYTQEFRLIGLVADRAATKLPLWDGEWLPDTKPNHLLWDTWALQVVESDNEEFKQRAGLVVVPVKGMQDTWQRVGYYGIGWRDNLERNFGQKQTITLV